MGAYDDLDPRFREWARELVSLAERFGMRPRVTSTRRSIQTQIALWDKRQRVLSGQLPFSTQPFPVAPPGTSQHELGLAIDVVVHPEGSQRVLGDVWTGWGGRWGGAGDPIHYGAGPRQLMSSPRGVPVQAPVRVAEVAPAVARRESVENLCKCRICACR